MNTPVTDKEIEEVLKKHPARIEWDYRDTLQNETLDDIVSRGQEALTEFEMEITEENGEQIDSALWETYTHVLAELEKDGERTFEKLEPDADEDEKLTHIQKIGEEEHSIDHNVERLGKNRGRSYFTYRMGEGSTFQAFRGIHAYEEVKETCDILNVSPHHLQDMVSPEEPELILPTIPEREGKEYVSLDGFKTMLKECMYGGEVVFLVGLQVEDVVRRPNAYRKGAVRIYKGTNVGIHCYMNGAFSMETPLIRDMDIPEGKATFHHDLTDKLGVQECCEMTDKVWAAGHALPKDPTKTK